MQDLRQLDLQLEASEGHAAKELHDQITAYFSQARDDILNDFIRAPSDSDELARIKMRMDALNHVERVIERKIFSGRLAQFELEDK